jgi:hypothetical protein
LPNTSTSKRPPLFSSINIINTTSPETDRSFLIPSILSKEQPRKIHATINVFQLHTDRSNIPPDTQWKSS